MTKTVDSIDALRIRQRLGRKEWGPPQPYGHEPGMGYLYDNHVTGQRIVVTAWYERDWGDGGPWVHASISYHDTAYMPTYADLAQLHRAVWGDTGHAYQVFVPPAEHINIRPNVLHLWGRMDGLSELPDFGRFGTI